MVADWMKDAGSPQPNAAKGADAAAKTEARKAAKALQKEKAAKNKLAAAALLRDVGQGTGTPPGRPAGEPRANRGVCSRFNTEAGCQFDTKCRFKHFIPSRSSDDWKFLSQYFADRKITPSAAFKTSQ